MDLVVLEDNMERAGVILVLIGSILLMGLLEYLFFKKKYKIINPISFFDIYTKVELPIVPFNNNNTFYFLVDSGSTMSSINKCDLDKMVFKDRSEEGNAFGIDGKSVQVSYVEAELTHGEHTYREIFEVFDITGFDNIESDYGVRICGIIGSSFMLRYNINIDYDTMMIYSKGKIYGKETKIQAIKSRWLRKLFGRNKRKE